jgi:hypothetical protein
MFRNHTCSGILAQQQLAASRQQHREEGRRASADNSSLPFLRFPNLKSAPAGAPSPLVTHLLCSNDNLGHSRRLVAHLHEWRVAPELPIPVNGGASLSFISPQ